MHRRAFLGTAATVSIALVAGCTRDDGGDGGGGGGGPYGMIGSGGADMAAEDPDGGDGRSASGESGGPSLGPEPGGDTEDR